MSYTPLAVILLLLVIGAGATLTVLFYANQQGHFRNLKSGAYLIFDDEEPVGTPQDQVFHQDDRPVPDDNERPGSSP